MHRLPLQAYNVVATADHAAACARLDSIVSGDRRAVRAPATEEPHVVNVVRTGTLRLLAASIPPCTIHARDDAAGVFFLVAGGRGTIRTGRREIDCRPGSIACMMPVADRSVEIGESLDVLGVRIAPEAIAAWMDDCQVVATAGWTSVFAAAVPGQVAVYRAFELFTALAGSMELDAPPPVAVLSALADGLVSAMSSLVLSLSGAGPPAGGATFGLARALEADILEHFHQPFSLAHSARKLRASPSAADRALRIHRGVGAMDLLVLTRASAAEHALSMGWTPELAANLAGFRNVPDMKTALRSVPAIRARFQRPRRFV